MKSNYKLIREPGKCYNGNHYKPGKLRILNLTTGILHPSKFKTPAPAKEMIVKLDAWHTINKSKNGRARTKRGNKLHMIAYNKNK